MSEKVRAARVPGLGATGEFPEGKIHESDEGAIKMAVAADPNKGVVILDFGTPVVWLGLPKANAIQLGELLIAKAGELKG